MDVTRPPFFTDHSFHVMTVSKMEPQLLIWLHAEFHLQYVCSLQLNLIKRGPNIVIHTIIVKFHLSRVQLQCAVNNALKSQKSQKKEDHQQGRLWQSAKKRLLRIWIKGAQQGYHPGWVTCLMFKRHPTTQGASLTTCPSSSIDVWWQQVAQTLLLSAAEPHQQPAPSKL